MEILHLPDNKTLCQAVDVKQNIHLRIHRIRNYSVQFHLHKTRWLPLVTKALNRQAVPFFNVVNQVPQSRNGEYQAILLQTCFVYWL